MINSPARGVYVFDISDPARLQQIGYYQDIAECWGIEVAGNYIYVADANDLKVFNFSSPPSLTLVGSYPLTPRGLTLRDGLAYVSQEYDGVKIYNVANPAAISLVGSFASPNSFTTGPVALSGNYAYVSDSWGLRILNIANPAIPTEVSYTPTRDETHWLVLNDNRVYLAEGSYGFSVYDVSNPNTPQLLNQNGVVGAVQVPALNNGRLLLASGEGGLQIYSETVVNPDFPVSTLPEEQQAPLRIQPGHTTLPDWLDTIKNEAAVQTEADVKVTCTVTSTANSGSNTLRACLDNQAAGNLITFSPTVFPPAAPVTIRIGPDPLPWVSKGNITIDASNAGVILNGSNVTGMWKTGIGINSNNNTVRGLQIINFPIGINILGHNNLIGGSRLVGNGPIGQGNVVSGSTQDGIAIYLGAHDNRVLGNLVGLNAAGTAANPNQWAGIAINQSPNNIIGSLNPGEDNIISANYGEGINLYGYDTLNTRVIGNKIGTDKNGNLNLGNHNVGLYLQSGTANTLVQGNLISSNGGAEVYIWDFGSDFNVLTGNRIGTNLAGTAPLPDLTYTGIATGNAAYTRIGGTAPGEGNVVANHDGVWVEGQFGANTVISGNHLGLNAAGTAVLTDAGGLRVGGATRSIVGGASPAEANYITRQGNFSLELRSGNNVIAGNYLGLATDGVSPLVSAGFQILSVRDGNIMQGNRIANATSAGIWLEGAQNNTIRRNLIWANPFKGIYLESNANNNLPAPNFSISAGGGSGTTCPGCTVELFLDEGNQGRFYLGSLTADDSGNFSFPPVCPLPYPNLTATATDTQGNTSEFSEGQPVSWDCSATRPAPVLLTLDPVSGTVFTPAFLLSVTGSGFYADSVVRWNGTALPTTVLSGTLAQAVIPYSLYINGGDFPVTVFTPAPGGGESGALIFSMPVPMQVFLPLVLR